MRYFLIAGEASGDLHAAHLMKALKERDEAAEFAYYGGDAMAGVAEGLLCHYRHLAYMGFVPVLLHLRTILKGMERCKQEMVAFRPDVVILVDYPGFNLRMARFVHDSQLCPVYYYISPKIWAWKERRIKEIRRNVDEMYCILPFEVEYFKQKHDFRVEYVGNPTVDEVADYRLTHPSVVKDERLIALLPGSRNDEIERNFSRMLLAVRPLLAQGYRVAVGVAPSQHVSRYQRLMAAAGVDEDKVELVEGQTFDLLSRSTVALVTSGTATLETALLGVPQVVCYATPLSRLVSWVRPYFLKVKFVSLVNLICGREVVRELVAADMTVEKVRESLTALLPGGSGRERMLEDYEEMRRILGEPGAPQHAAEAMLKALRGEKEE